MKKQEYKRKTADAIVASVNTRCGTNVNARTVRRYVGDGKIGIIICKRGKKSAIPDEAMEVLKDAMVSHVQLSNSGMKQMPTRKYMIMKLKEYLKTSKYSFKRMNCFYDRLIESVAHMISFNTTDYKIEERRLRWTTYNNINVWFDTMRTFFIEK